MKTALKTMSVIAIISNTAGVIMTYHLRNSMPEAHKMFFFFIGGVCIWSIGLLMFSSDDKKETRK
jgi:hypothetical protein